jgi:hypothetical protein
MAHSFARFSASARASLPALASSTLAALLGMALSAPVQAQTAYSLTVLKPSSTSANARIDFVRSWSIDNSNRVVSEIPWLDGYGYSVVTFKFQATFNTYISRWPASTAASVGPGKLYPTRSAHMGGLSPSGQLLVVDHTLYDTVSKAKTTVMDFATFAELLELNDSGMLAVTGYQPGFIGQPRVPTVLPQVWTAAAGLTSLPVGAAGGGRARLVNASGTVAGEVQDAFSGEPTAAWWTNGVLNTVRNLPGTASSALGIDNSGRILVGHVQWTCPTDVGLVCSQVQDHLALRNLDGTELTLTANSLNITRPAILTGSGAVFGTVATSPGETRPVVWINGVAQDLNTFVTAKGAKLPTGATLTQVLAANDQGSFVARMLGADKSTVSIVRLTAR